MIWFQKKNDNSINIYYKNTCLMASPFLSYKFQNVSSNFNGFITAFCGTAVIANDKEIVNDNVIRPLVIHCWKISVLIEVRENKLVKIFNNKRSHTKVNWNSKLRIIF